MTDDGDLLDGNEPGVCILCHSKPVSPVRGG